MAYFDYVDALEIRQMVLAPGDLDLPRYLLVTEIAVLLAYLPDLRQRLLIDTLSNTGAQGVFYNYSITQGVRELENTFTHLS